MGHIFNSIIHSIMKIAIVGSRTFQNYDLMCEFIERKLSDEEFNSVEAVVSGGTRGADSLAEQYARENGLEMILFKADWRGLGSKAGPMRNVEIIRECDICFAFWDGKSSGTRHDIELCKQMGKVCHICKF